MRTTKRTTRVARRAPRSERCADASDRRFRDLIHGLDAIVWEADAATLHFSFVSRRAEEMLGYPADHWLAQPDFWTVLVHPEDRTRVIDLMRAKAARDDAFQFEFRALAADGRVLWLRNRVRIVSDRRGRPRWLRGLMVDITELHLAGEARRQLIAIIEATTDFVGITDVSGAVIYLNQAGRRMLGIGDAASVAHMNAADFQPAATRRLLLEVAIPAATRDGVWSGETELLLHDGRAVPISQVVVAHRTPAGRVDFFATIARDISDRKRAEEEKAALLEVARDISGTLDIEEILQRVQHRMATLLPCDIVLIFYWDPTRDVFRMIAHHGVPVDLLPELESLTFPPGTPFEGRVERGETVLINDVASQTSLPADLMAHFHVSALVAAPLNVRGRNLGAVIAFNTVSGRAFAPTQVELCEAIARQLALAFETTELYRAQQHEAEIAAALARVGREMISSLDTPTILDRLCQLTTEVLGCDVSHTVLWKADENAYVPVSGYGDSPEQWEAIRLMRLPAELVAPLMERLRSDDVFENPTPPAQTHQLARLADAHGLKTSLYVALRRGDEIVGYHTARYRDRVQRFTAEQKRIFGGMAQLASMALENARLVEELERASGLKTDFVATMSHELRTPLNVIVGYNELLLDGIFGAVNAEQVDTLRRIDKSAHELLELINATLDVSRLETGRVRLEMRNVSLADLTAEIDAELRDQHSKPGVEFGWRLPSAVPALRTDPMKLKVVLKNLINNALKFTDQGSVTVSVEPGDRQVHFAVADTGIGIPTDAQGMIFEPFRQADSSMTRRHGGVGLGLYIVRRLVDMLGGDISIDSEVGRGSTFRVSLPSETSAES